MPEHRIITDPHIHEPKGISTANEGMIYVADGAGSGNWRYWPFGKAFYQHAFTSAQVINTTPSRLQVNGLGTLTQTSRLPREIAGGSLWDTANYKLLPIRQNDVYTLRVDLPVTAESGAVTELGVQFDIGGASSPTNVIMSKFYKVGRSVPYTISFDTTLDVLSSISLSNGIQIFLKTDTGTVTLGNPGLLIAKTIDGDL